MMARLRSITLAGLLLIASVTLAPGALGDHAAEVEEDACALDPLIAEQWRETVDGSRGCGVGARVGVSPVRVTVLTPATSDDEASLGETEIVQACDDQGVNCDVMALVEEQLPLPGVCPTANTLASCLDEALASLCPNGTTDCAPDAHRFEAFVQENVAAGRTDTGAWLRLFGANESASVTTEGDVVVTVDEEGTKSPLGGDYRAHVCPDDAAACAMDPDQDGTGGTTGTATEVVTGGNPLGPDESGADTWAVRVFAGANGFAADAGARVLEFTDEAAGSTPAASVSAPLPVLIDAEVLP